MRSVNCRHSLEILNRLPFKIVSSQRIRLSTFSIVPQLSKCLKFEVVWEEGINLLNDLNLNKEM